MRRLLFVTLLSFVNLSSGSLQWRNISRPYERGALCNDFTPAGYFARVDPSITRWVIFLEGGGGCTTPESCNERFIVENVRDRYTTIVNRSRVVNVTAAWQAFRNTPLSVTSKLMTSLWRFAPNAAKLSQSWSIEGEDLLSANISENPDFYSYNHILVPYCTSDLWLQQSANYKLALQPDFNFTFDPTATSHQFTFRGAVVFRSIVSDLEQQYNFSNASEVVFAGSSAGGVGVLNHAKWLHDRLPATCQLSAITDSSWFIDFRDTITNEVTRMNITNLVKNNEIISSCSDPSKPTVCLTAHQLLRDTSLYPNIPTLVVMSKYDLYILTRLLQQNRPTSIAVLDLLRTVSEFGGSMHSSLQSTSLSFRNLSYYSMSCFQHVYLAASSLSQQNGLLAATSVARVRANNAFLHSVNSRVWTSFSLHLPDSRGPTIAMAIHRWLEAQRNHTTIYYEDACKGPHCNSNCPDQVILGRVSPYWGTVVQCVLLAAGLVSAAICGIAKVTLMLCYKRVEKKQLRVIEECAFQTSVEESTLPSCNEDDAISVACLNIRYSVTLSKSALKRAANSATGPQRYKRLLSLSAGSDGGSYSMAPRRGSEGYRRRRSRQVQSNEQEDETDMVGAIHQFRNQYEQDQQPGLSRGRARRSTVGASHIQPCNSDDNETDMVGAIHQDQQPGLSRGRARRSTVGASHIQPSNSDDNETDMVGAIHQDQQPGLSRGRARRSTVGASHIQPSNSDENNETGDMNDMVSAIHQFRRKYEQQQSNTGVSRGRGRRSVGAGHTQACNADDTNGGGDMNDMLSQLQQFRRQYEQQQQMSRCSKFKNFLKKKFSKSNKKKEILKGISAYFNPGEMVAIMGPSGCGKTTLLDLLAGRRNTGNYKGEIFVNGVPLESNQDWYITHTGYVLQLGTPYYSELTVRENLTFAAQMRLPQKLPMRDKLERVEQIIVETGLKAVANTPVGGSVGPGLSGGQKRRLCVALQLINLPSMIFLDEPTSGLDASSSLELLTYLNRLAGSNRAVILTIHQPRLEIFHMFHKIILLCQGQVAYHGVPDKAYDFFVEAHLQATLTVKRLHTMDSKNPADTIMDMLGSEECRVAILNYYNCTQERVAVRRAIEEGKNGTETGSSKQKSNTTAERGGFLNHIIALESRAMRRANIGQTLYLPVIFAVYGILLGTVYFQTQNVTLILSGLGVFSCASGLFLFPLIYGYLFPALEIFALEFSDGIGKPIHVILQAFVRFSSLSALPILFCGTSIYLLAVPYSEYNIYVFLQVVAFSIILNQAWIALLMSVITSIPTYAHRISPVLSAIAGFAGGFFVPPNLMPLWYKWLFYINPTYYGFSAIARVVLQNLSNKCPYDSPIECYPTSARYVLTYFSLHNTNPYLHVTILLAMTVFFLLLSWFSLAVRHSYILPRLSTYLKKRFRKTPPDYSTNTSTLPNNVLQDDNSAPLSPVSSLSFNSAGSVVYEEKSRPPRHTSGAFRSSFGRLSLQSDDHEYGPTSSILLHEGESHELWKPGKRISLRRNTLESRKSSLFGHVSGAQGSVSDEQTPTQILLTKRLQQWSKIERDAFGGPNDPACYQHELSHHSLVNDSWSALGGSQTNCEATTKPESIALPISDDESAESPDLSNDLSIFKRRRRDSDNFALMLEEGTGDQSPPPSSSISSAQQYSDRQDTSAAVEPQHFIFPDSSQESIPVLSIIPPAEDDSYKICCVPSSPHHLLPIMDTIMEEGSSLDESSISPINTDCNFSVDSDSVADDNSSLVSIKEQHGLLYCGHNENLPSTCTSILTSQPAHSTNTRGVITNVEGSGSSGVTVVVTQDNQDCSLPQPASNTAKPHNLLHPSQQSSDTGAQEDRSPYSVRNSVFYFAQLSPKPLTGSCQEEKDCTLTIESERSKTKMKKEELRSPMLLRPRVLHSPRGSLVPTSPLLYSKRLHSPTESLIRIPTSPLLLHGAVRSPSHGPLEETDV